MLLHDVPLSPPAPHSASRLERVEQLVKDLESRVHDAEYRIRLDLLQRDSAWRERIMGAMSLLCRMLAAVVPDSPSRGHREGRMPTVPEESLIPDVNARAITLDEYDAHVPEKVELVRGYLISSADDPEARRRLLRLLLVNAGLIAAVALAPEERWREALRQVYG